jgi:hypothetical protein
VTTLSGAPASAPPGRPQDAGALLQRSKVSLDALFQDSPPGDIPSGDTTGTIVFAPGTVYGPPTSRALGALFWRGKIFHPATEDLHNKILPFGIPAVRAQTYVQDSWLDDRPCVVLDYSKTSFVAGWIRDEIREVAPGLYLGLVWGVGRLFGGRRLILRFALKVES